MQAGQDVRPRASARADTRPRARLTDRAGAEDGLAREDEAAGRRQRSRSLRLRARPALEAIASSRAWLRRGSDRPTARTTGTAPAPLGPELDCLRGRLPVAVLSAAERRAATVGVSADRVLIATGGVDEESYIRAFAAAHGIGFLAIDEAPRALCACDDDRLLHGVAAGLLPLADGEGWLIAPRHVAARRLAALFARHPEWARSIRLTTPARLHRFGLRHGAAALGRHAAGALRRAHPHLSAAALAPSLRAVLAAGTVAAGCIAAATTWPAAALLAAGLACTTILLAWSALRLAALFVPDTPVPLPRVPDRDLPLYTILVALHREAAVLPGLVAALRALDYPPEKLDIKLVLEADDGETRAAAARLALAAPFEIWLAPAAGPRTKPKALNAALPFARGAFTVIYDAEDRPDPDQLRRAVAAFAAAGPRTACLQARLTIDNTADGLLARLFTAEYAGLFDVLLPALSAWNLPLPLGGSSNHFRTDVLRKAGGWDPHNVTEDADLGIRLARLGWRTGMIAASTYEEAPATLPAWIRQRTRWMKGWMQTWLVHMRSPRRLCRELGPAGFLTVQLVVAGSVLSALVHPLWLALLLAGSGRGLLFATDASAWLHGVTALAMAGFVAGYGATILLGLTGLARRGLLASAPALFAIPIYWLLLSFAAWRGLYQLLRDPFRWEKTEHGRARTSRRPHR